MPHGGAVTIDGQADAAEWDDAAVFEITPAPDWTVTVHIKHDGQGLLLMFSDIQPPAPPPIAFPEVMIDVGNDKASELGDDDWWFHVSATDCHAVGEYDNYDGCVDEATGWAANNFPANSLISVVEIRIGFDTLGVDPGAQPQLGLLLRLSDTQAFSAHWPEAAQPDSPAGWASAVICPPS